MVNKFVYFELMDELEYLVSTYVFYSDEENLYADKDMQKSIAHRIELCLKVLKMTNPIPRHGYLSLKRYFDNANGTL